MLVTNAGKLDGQMLRNIGAVIVSAEAANMRLGVLVVLLGFEMFFLGGRAHFSWRNGRDLYRNHRQSDNFGGPAFDFLDVLFFDVERQNRRGCCTTQTLKSDQSLLNILCVYI